MFKNTLWQARKKHNFTQTYRNFEVIKLTHNQKLPAVMFRKLSINPIRLKYIHFKSLYTKQIKVHIQLGISYVYPKTNIIPQQ